MRKQAGWGAIRRDLTSIRRAVRALDKTLARLAAVASTSAQNGSAPVRGRSRRKLKLSPVRINALRLQGRYLGYMRQLKSRAKAEVRALRAKKGVKAAIKRARKLAGK